LEELILSTNNHVICWHIHVRNNHVCSVENYWIFQVLSSIKYAHYRKDGLCRAPKDLPCAFHRAHGKGHSLPCAHATLHGSDKRTVQISLPCVATKAHGKEQPVPCVGP
jgi:hypothetical protein